MHRPIGRPAALLATLGAMLLAGCGDNDPTGPEDISAPAMDRLAAPAGEQADAPLAATASRLPRSFFINPKTGSDANAGTSLKPFKTLAKGLSLAISGDTMRLAVGIYSAATNGEKFTTASRQVTVPAGVKIFGTNFGDALSHLEGASGDLIGLDLKGGATIRNVMVSGFVTGLRATQGSQTLKGMQIDGNARGLVLQGTAKVVYTNSFIAVHDISGTLAKGAELIQQAQLVIDGGGIINTTGTCSQGNRGVTLESTARLTLKNSAAIQSFPAASIEAIGSSQVTLLSGTSVTRSFTGLPCSPAAAIVLGVSASATLTNALVSAVAGTGTTGILNVGDGLLTLNGAKVSGHTGAGVALQNGAGRLTATGSTFEGNGTGIDASSLQDADVSVTGSTLTKNTVGIRTPFLRLRGSNVSGNGTAVLITRSARFSDLGQTFEPGNNLFLNNGLTGVTFGPTVVSSGFGAVFASGNTWNVTQGADGSGRYPLQPVVTGDSPNAQGSNFRLPSTVGTSGSFSIQL